MSNSDRAGYGQNPDGAGPFVIVCDHASNRIPEDTNRCICRRCAGDAHCVGPGCAADRAAPVATLDAPLLWPDVSRLVIDCNRDAGRKQSHRHRKRGASGPPMLA